MLECGDASTSGKGEKKPSKELEAAWSRFLLLSLEGMCEEEREKGRLILSNFWK